MKKVLISIFLIAIMFCTLACNQPSNQWNWKQVTPLIENVTTITAQIAFAQPNIQPYKEKICKATLIVADILNDYNDSDATFNTIRQLALDTINNLSSDILDNNLKPIVIVTIDSVINGSWLFVKRYHSNMIENNETRIVLIVAKSIAKGVSDVCDIHLLKIASN